MELTTDRLRASCAASVATTLSIPTGKGEDDKREREQYRLVALAIELQVAAAVNQSARHDRERRAKRPRTIELMPLILGPDFAAQDAQGDRGGDDDDHDGADENSGEVDAGAQVLDVAAYKARIRSILASLRVNATLRENVMSGKVSARFLARADASDLATDETRQVEVQAKEEFMRSLVTPKWSDAEGYSEMPDKDCPGCKETGFVGRKRIAVHVPFGREDTWGSRQELDEDKWQFRCSKCEFIWS